MRIGWIGAGAMGFPMVQALLDKGWTVKVYDVKPEPIHALAREGAIGLNTVNGEFADVQALGLMVQNFSQCRDVLLNQGVIEQLRPGTLLAVFSTIGPAAAETVASWAEPQKVRVLDAPVSGGPRRARGHLSMMYSGAPETIEQAQPLMEALADTRYHVGDRVGQGQAVKTINQLLAGVHIAVSAEALTLAEKMGMNPELVLDVVSQSAGSSWMFKDRAPRMLHRDYQPPKSALAIFVKDLGIVQEAAQSVGMPLILASSAFQLFQSGASRGMAHLDDSSVVDVYRSLAGLE
ncbi:NAD(P)-dependent oxidoreductase [Sulfobacillus harzensis]|uniref:NAD(P)-dependent oxidoreductase n=1 Tax=Sulfobacillus harzensis TaxID=2729629 RepID=A0A7Y0L3U8_9FIRM|nr:NAD(P)-dependent oxidoreductase [Sulfobacillus harzensis]NMP21399.1 NAD(P)-dependent oxidoreductase [Sulfobacillus harzensis]